MSLWWARKEQLDRDQIALIEQLPLRQDHLILGPPGSGKTNVLLRRAQFVRGQEMPNVMVLTFTRSLTEFVKTGCFDAQGREIFPQTLVTTIESWMRSIYRRHGRDLPDRTGDLLHWKSTLAREGMDLVQQNKIPLYDTIFVDEAQDLVSEEVQFIRGWGRFLFFVGDDRQRIFGASSGLSAVRQHVPGITERNLEFHYRLAPEICRVADRLLTTQSGQTLESTSHYEGPRPGGIFPHGPLSDGDQLEQCAATLKDQVRVYADFIRQGDRLGIVVARTDDRDRVYAYLEADAQLQGKSKIIRARSDDEDGRSYDPSFDPDIPICILTVQGCKGLEFRALHWLFAEQLSYHHTLEHYYTVVTRTKTRLDLYYTNALPTDLARAYAAPGGSIW
jgi:superfamily I DNA/RNA helicase